jgi:tetratricopeptide (TPR) repeat protein
MKGAPFRTVLVCTGVLGGWSEAAASAQASPLADAIALYKLRRFAEAKAAIERIVAAEPTNAPALYYLAMTVQHADPPSLDDARPLLAKAVQLDPRNETYLAEYGGVTMLLADRDHSLGLALDGRDAMAEAIRMNPADLDAREGLMRFCAKAPWPLGDPGKALDLAHEIAKCDPRRGEAAYHRIAVLFEKQGRVQEARAAAQAAQDLAGAAAK